MYLNSRRVSAGRFLHFVVAASLFSSVVAAKNVVFIVADDLRNDLGCYGNEEVITPNLDALAKRGVVFDRAYCQQAVCNPSRASVLTGLRPDTVKVWDLQTHFRDRYPDLVTLPQYFKQHGYYAKSIGKIFHNDMRQESAPLRFFDRESWSDEPTFGTGPHWRDWVVPGDPSGPRRKDGAVQCLDVSDNAYLDGQIADAAIQALAELKLKGSPFFLAVGFWKPHLPFNAPKKYWDLYERSELSEPAHLAPPKGAPPISRHRGFELRTYEGIPKEGPIPRELMMELRHGYLACISFLDAQVGRVIDELDRLGLADDTIVVFWSDHGFHLGESDLWAKTSNYELDARVPLLVAAQGEADPGRTVGEVVELVDLYPTIVELAGLPAKGGLDGRSFAASLTQHGWKGRGYAITQHPHPFYQATPTAMGYAIRTQHYRYVEWIDLNTGDPIAKELYDHRIDPFETINRYDESTHAAAVAELGAALRPHQEARKSIRSPSGTK